MKTSSKSGFVLPVVVSCIVVVGVIGGTLMNYVVQASRTTSIYATASVCRLSAQSSLDQAEDAICQAFKTYFRENPRGVRSLQWFDVNTAQSIGLTGYACALPQDATVEGCTVSVEIDNIETVLNSNQLFRRLTLRATASAISPSGTAVTKSIAETVEYALQRSRVFDHAYFVNNYGWFMGGGVTANGDIRANGNLSLDGNSTINGYAYAAPNDELGAAGVINLTGTGITKFETRANYWKNQTTRARPTNPTADTGGSAWDMGYEAKRGLFDHQENLEMPFLGDLDGYRDVAYDQGATIKQNGKTLVDGCYSGPGPSGLTNGVDKGCLVLDGTVKPIEINGPVVVDGDVIIKGTIKGQGAIYAGRNIHIVGNITYSSAPSWPKPDTNPNQTITKNASTDMLGLVAKGNIIMGDSTDANWLKSIKQYMTTPFVKPYECDDSDAAIGYPSTFNGNYTAADGGEKVTYTYNSTTKKYEPSGKTARKYYESTAGDQVIKNTIQATTITQIDAVLYNNHGTFGKVDKCYINGALVSRDEGVYYSSWVKFNWDSRLGSRSADGLDFFIHLPLSIADPKIIGWNEVY